MRSWGGCSPSLPFLSALEGHCVKDCPDPHWAQEQHKHTSPTLKLQQYGETQRNGALTFWVWRATRTGCRWPAPRSRCLEKRINLLVSHRSFCHSQSQPPYRFYNSEIGRSPWAPSWGDLTLEQIQTQRPTGPDRTHPVSQNTAYKWTQINPHDSSSESFQLMRGLAESLTSLI